MLHALALAAVSSVAFYTLSGYMVTYLTTAAQLSSSEALVSNGIALTVGFVFFWVGGALSDRFGRRPVIFGALIATVLLYLPSFWLAGLGVMWTALIGQSIIAMIFGIYWGVIGVTVVELFPTRNRMSGATISWNLAYTVFGGTAPLLATWMIAQTGLIVMPGIYMMVLAIIALVMLRHLPETAGASMLHDEDRAAPVTASNSATMP